LDAAAPHVHLITETNVPHVDNVSYFGDGHNEAQLVYNFALPPLTLHAFHTGDARILSDWARTLTLPSDKTTFFNFLASHDGIGLNPARGILSDADIDSLVLRVSEHGGLISYKHNADGTHSPYEMNINYFDALSNPNGTEPPDLQVKRFIAAQAIMLSIIGVPGIYFHSLFGSRGWLEGVQQTGRNREKLQLDILERDLADPDSLRAKVFRQYCRLLQARRSLSAFHPHGTQQILDVHPSVFAVQRISPDEHTRVLCVHNVGSRRLTLALKYGSMVDLLTDRSLEASNLSVEPYQVLWIKQ
jgi:sucrose phosphorylase